MNELMTKVIVEQPRATPGILKSWEGRDFPQAGRASPWDFPQPLPLGNPMEQPCQPSDNTALPSSFNWKNLMFNYQG